MIALIQKVPLFKTLTLEKLHLISSKIETLKYDSNQTVFNAGDPGNALYIIKTGSVAVLDIASDGREFILSKLDAGSYFGEMALLTGDTRSVTIRTSNKSILLKLSRDDFQFLLNENVAMYIPISHVLSYRLKTANERRLDENSKLKQRYAPSGSLSNVSVNTILMQCEKYGLNGFVILQKDTNKGKISFIRGDITCISLNDVNNPDFLHEILNWRVGTFEIDPLPFCFAKRTSVKNEPVKIHDSKKVTLTDLVNTMNLICQSAVQIIGKTIIGNLLKQIQKSLFKDHPELYIFIVNGVLISLYKQSGNREIKEAELVAIALWVRKLINECSRFELRFATFDIEEVTRAYYDILQDAGFYNYYSIADDY